MKNVVVIGYASIDYPAVLDGYFRGDQTVMIKQRPVTEFPRPGGCPLYVARPIAGRGRDVAIITWIGDDEQGALFTRWTADDGIDTRGIATIESGSTPVCFMIYQVDGSCCCCFDPGMLGRESLTSDQEELLKNADLLCVTVGPPEIAMRALTLVSDQCVVAWVMKNDPISYPEELRIALASRARYIFCNDSERASVDNALQISDRDDSPLIIQTAGSGPVLAELAESSDRIDVPQLTFNDASGAGDTLAGGCLDSVCNAETNITAIAQSGVDAATSLLRSRSTE